MVLPEDGFMCLVRRAGLDLAGLLHTREISGILLPP